MQYIILCINSINKVYSDTEQGEITSSCGKEKGELHERRNILTGLERHLGFGQDEWRLEVGRYSRVRKCDKPATG